MLSCTTSTSVSPLSTCLWAPPLGCIPPSSLSVKSSTGRNGLTIVVPCVECYIRYRHRGTVKAPAGGELVLSMRDISVGMLVWELPVSWAVWNEGVGRFVTRDETGGKQGPCMHLIYLVWNFVVKALGASLMAGKPGKDVIRSGPCRYQGGWGGRNEISGFRAQGVLQYAAPSVCPKNVSAGENLVIQEESVLPDSSALSKKLHTT